MKKQIWYEIILKKGLMGIPFGVNKSYVFKVFGEPDEIEESNRKTNYNWTTMNYNSINYSFSFDPDFDDKLVEISTRNINSHVSNRIKIGIKKNELLQITDELQLGKPFFENFNSQEAPTHELISFDDYGLNLWLDDEMISTIQISPVFNIDDSIRWP